MKVLLTFALCVSLATAASAQDSTRVHPGRGDHRMTDLHLSTTQQEQLKTINKDFFTSSRSIMKDSTLGKTDRQAKFKALQATRQDKIKGVLSADQYAQWQQDMNNRRSRMGQAHRGFDGPRHRPGFAKMQERTKQDLGLTDAQSQQLASANKEFFKNMSDLHKNSASSDSATRRAQFQSLRTAYQTKVKGILNADQYTKWQDHQKQMMAHMRQGRPGFGGRPDFAKMNDRMKQDLGLSDAQSQKLAAARGDFFKNARALRENSDTAARRTQFKALRQQYDAQVQSILTPDQFAKLQERKKEMRAHLHHGRPNPDATPAPQQ